MSLDLFKNIVDDSAGWVQHMQIANFGEPLLNRNLKEMIEYAVSNGFFVEIFTNGTLLSEKVARMLVHSRVDIVNISVDALNPNVYYNLRGTRLDSVLANIQALSSTRNTIHSHTPFIAISAADLISNPGEANAISHQFSNIGADSYIIGPSANWAGSAIDSQVVKQLGKKYCGCLVPWYVINISYDGIVSACCIDPELRNRIGHFPEASLKEIWNGNHMRDFRRALLSKDLSLLSRISSCNFCSHLYYDQNDLAINRIFYELKILKYFLFQ